MNKSLSKNFFLISFLPALAYWYLEEHYPVRIAVAGGLLLAVLEIIAEKKFLGHVHSISKFNFFLILFLGGLSLLGDEGIWFKLQPALTGIGIGSYLLYRNWKGKGLLLEMMQEMNRQNLPEDIVRGLEKHFSLFFLGYGAFMGGVAFLMSTPRWLFWKTLGFYLVFFVFMAGEMVLIRMTVKKRFNIK